MVSNINLNQAYKPMNFAGAGQFGGLNYEIPKVDLNFGNMQGLSLGEGFTNPEALKMPELPGLDIPEVQTTDPTWSQKAFGYTEIDPLGNKIQNQGWLSPTIDAIGGVSNIYFGLKALEQAEDQFDFQKEAFDKNYEANKLSFNNAVQTQQDAKANAMSNRELGISDQATPEERAQAEAAFAKEAANTRKL